MNYDPMLCAKGHGNNRAKVLIEVPIPRTSTKVLEPRDLLTANKNEPFPGSYLLQSPLTMRMASILFLTSSFLKML